LDTQTYIDNYFMGDPSADMRKEFEKKLAEDKEFAEEVAFYLSAKDVIGEEALIEKKERFKKLYEDYKKANAAKPQKSIVRKLWPYLAAAAIIAGVIIGRNMFLQPSTEQIADNYIKDNFQTLSVTMSNRVDSLQTGLRLFNQGKLNDALQQFESIVKRDTSSTEAKKYVGIVYLRMQQYDKAIEYFSLLANNTQIFANPGKLYHAVTLMKRNLPGDLDKAKQLLQQVVSENEEGRKEAEGWLRKWK